MKAIVMSCDKYVNLTDHMIHTYQQLWPTHPFQFIVPYQSYPGFLKDKYGDKIELVKTGRDIMSTMKVLLDLFKKESDNEWVYWCIDDKYLINIDEDKANFVFEWVSTVDDPDIVSVIFARCRGLCGSGQLVKPGYSITNTAGQIFLQREPMTLFWIHGFLRVKIIKEVFSHFPAKDFNAKEMDTYLYNMRLRKVAGLYNQSLKWFVLKNNIVKLGESTHRGKLTANCAASLEKWGMSVPGGFEQCNKNIVMGKMPGRKFPRFRLPF